MQTKPSEHWEGFNDLKASSEKYELVRQVISNANFRHLETCAIESRQRLQPELSSRVSCSANLTQFTTGFNNVVVELTFSDQTCWLARIPYRTFDSNERISLLSEIATMRAIRERTKIPVSHIYAFNMSAEQPFGYPYVLMEYLGGRSLDIGIATSVPPEHHEKVANQLANVFAELQKLTFDRIGRLWCGENVDEPLEIVAMGWHCTPGPLDTSLEYLYNQQQEQNREIMTLHPGDPDWLTACWVLKTAIARVVIEDRIRGPFPLCHLDLHFGNMLFDNDFNLTGIIDWSNAQAAPLEQLSVCPELIIFPGRSDEDNKPIVDLRRMVIRFLQEAESYDEGSLPGKKAFTLSKYMASGSAEIMHRLHMASPKGSLFAGKRVAELMYGKSVTWEQLKEVYGAMPLL
jgi:hypothetical protein